MVTLSPSAATGARGAAGGGQGSEGAGPGGSQLQEPQFPAQLLVLSAAPADLQLQHRVAAVHQLADLRHGRVGQDLHDGGQLRVEGGGWGHLCSGRTDGNNLALGERGSVTGCKHLRHPEVMRPSVSWTAHARELCFRQILRLKNENLLNLVDRMVEIINLQTGLIIYNYYN